MSEKNEITVDKSDFVTITHGIRGYFVVCLSWDDEIKGHVPDFSGFGSYETPQEAEQEARRVAEDEGVRLELPDYEELIASVARQDRMSARRRELMSGGMSSIEAFRTTMAEFRAPVPS